jgi:hypothetical protein
MKNRMRELRTCGSVRGEGREALAYSETKKQFPRGYLPLQAGARTGQHHDVDATGGCWTTTDPPIPQPIRTPQIHAAEVLVRVDQLRHLTRIGALHRPAVHG